MSSALPARRDQRHQGTRYVGVTGKLVLLDSVLVERLSRAIAADEKATPFEVAASTKASAAPSRGRSKKGPCQHRATGARFRVTIRSAGLTPLQFMPFAG
jgi:hypothetical protein